MAQETVDAASDRSAGTPPAATDRSIATGAASQVDVSPGRRRPGWQIAARITFVAVAWLLVVGLIVQVFLAGLGVFDSPERFELHASFGFTLMALPFIMLLSGLVGAVGRRFVGLAGLMLGLFFLQSILVSLRDQAPAIAALHPLNGFLILFASVAVARASLAMRRATAAAPESVA